MAAVSSLRCQGALIWMFLNLLRITVAKPAALQSITTEVINNYTLSIPINFLPSFICLPKYPLTYQSTFRLNYLHTQQLYYPPLLTLPPTVPTAPSFHSSSSQELWRHNLVGVRCIRQLGGWSWNRRTSSTWPQDRPQGDPPSKNIPLTALQWKWSWSPIKRIKELVKCS